MRPLFPVIAYIDPGTGSLLFALFLGIFSALQYFFKSLWIRFKFWITGGRGEKMASAKAPLIIFSDDKRYWNVFGPICDELEKRGATAEYWTMSEDDPAFDKDYKHIKTVHIEKGNKGYARLNIMRANICLSTTPGLDVYQWKRSRYVDKYIHIYHDVSEGMRYRMFGLDYYDTILLNAAFQERYIRILEEKRNIPHKECVVVGSVYLDDMVRKVGSSLSDKFSHDKPNLTVLMAPSWGPSAILAKFGSVLIDELIATGFDIIIRPHPQSFTAEPEIINPLLEKYKDLENVVWDLSNSNIESLSKADILISDFSGIVLDYSLVFDGPVIVANTEFDPSVYDAAWIDEPLWMDQILGKIGIELNKEDFANIKNVIIDLISSDKYASGRHELRDEVWNDRGNAVTNVVNYILADINTNDKGS